MRYNTPETAAENINVLLGYIKSEETPSSSFVYRGQVREWEGPLLPSQYRNSIQLKRMYSRNDPEYRYSLRQCGNLFIEMKPDSFLEKLVQDNKQVKISPKEHRAILYFSTHPEFSKSIAISGYERAVSEWFPPKKLPKVFRRFWLWKSNVRRNLWLCQLIIDEMQRALIRHYGFMQPFGYILGQTLAQQYGFGSELLDFTSDVHIAAYFATHDGPHYTFEGTSISNRIGSSIGVIYRLPSTEGNVRHERIDTYNYYSSPSQLHMAEICKRFEDKSSPEMLEQLGQNLTPEEKIASINYAVVYRQVKAMMVENEMKEHKFTIQESVDHYLDLYFHAGGIRYYRLLDLPKESFNKSRLGRQSAVLIVPDELRQTVHSDREPDFAAFQAVEDISKRNGFEQFYFRHSDIGPKIGQINREYLWPKENDVFKIIVSRILDPLTKVHAIDGVAVPKRIDLISSGYSDS